MNRWSAVLVIASAAVVGVVAATGCNNAACSPACTTGFVCTDGVCKAQPCQPGCDAGFSCTLGQCIADAGMRLARLSTCEFTLVNGGQLGPATAPACQKTVSPSQAPGAQVQAFGVKPVGAVVSFNVPPGTESFTIMQQGVRSVDRINYIGYEIGNAAVPDLVTSPTQGLLFNDNPLPDAGSGPNPEQSLLFYVPADRDVATMTVPNTGPMLAEAADGGVAPGTWSFMVSDYANECLTLSGCDGGTDAGAYDVTVVTKPEGPAGVRTVDLSFILISKNTQRAAFAIQDAHFNRMVDALASIYQPAGICPGTVTVYDAPEWAQSAYAAGLPIDDQSDCGPLPQLFSIAPNGDSLTFFLVSELLAHDSGGQFQVVGLDGTIPGPSGFPRTVNSGAAISAADVYHGTCSSTTLSPGSCGPDLTAYIAAHEGGHWLGLYHTTEQFGADFDPLTDTPRCVCGTCTTGSAHASCVDVNPNASSPTQVTSGTCSGASIDCGGADNLMFWLAGNNGRLTAQQAAVMRANLVVH